MGHVGGERKTPTIISMKNNLLFYRWGYSSFDNSHYFIYKQNGGILVNYVGINYHIFVLSFIEDEGS